MLEIKHHAVFNFRDLGGGIDPPHTRLALHSRLHGASHIIFLIMLDDILFVLVTCTREESRKRGLEACIRSLNSEHARVPLNGNLVVFDNASLFPEPLRELKIPAVFAMSPENVGYWGALHWTMRNIERLLGREFAFVHPIESDFTIYNIERLTEAKKAFDVLTDLHTVRTQEFSVRLKSRYFKNSWNPFRVRRSHVANHNLVTGERVWFAPVGGLNGMYVTNWHAKVPALHRFAPFQDAVEELADREQLTELDFMKAMHRRRAGVGMVDGGIWWMDFTEPPKAKTELSGSYSGADTLNKYGYRNTRCDYIPKTMPEIKISRVPT
jgi:hypothetical protein